MNSMAFLFCFFSFLIFWAMIGYNISLKIIYSIKKKRLKNNEEKNIEYPTVSVLIVAHNEEKVIKEKLSNMISLQYPSDRIEYIVASDNSTDQTENIVNAFTKEHSDYSIKLYSTKEHKGKTNAQNEAQKICSGEILIMTDANSIFKRDAIIELVKSFNNDNVSYVCGKLEYTNTSNNTANAEATYWERDLKLRFFESEIYTITAGNGAIYACRNKEYIIIPDIESHDLYMPYIYGKNGKRAIYNQNAVAYEKAGENDLDEFKRKVRMNRNIITNICDGMKVINFIKYGWFAFFFFGHRTCRYLLWLSHLIVLVSSIFLANSNIIFLIILILQVLFYSIGIYGICKKESRGLIRFISYYCMTIFAQICGVKNCLLGKSKATWTKAETTR